MPVPVAVASPESAASALNVTVEYIDEGGGRVRAPLAMSSQVRFERSSPIRATRSFRGQRNFGGLWWIATTRSHVGFESWLKRDQLIMLDFDPSVVGISSWPLSLHWRTDIGERHRSPDYFVRLADGAAVVLDVRTNDMPESDDECAVTAAACAQVGWPTPSSRQIGSGVHGEPAMVGRLPPPPMCKRLCAHREVSSPWPEGLRARKHVARDSV